MTPNPNQRPKIFDVCGGAGGSAEGYRRAGWDVTVVDTDPTVGKNVPAGIEFVCMDAFEFIADHGRDFDAGHAGPPCQRKARMTKCRPGVELLYPNLVNPIRVMLDWLGLPYVIENVVGSDARPDLTLCGAMFGLPLYRHRVFELGNWPGHWLPEAPGHPRHSIPASRAGHWKPGTIMSVAGHVSPIAEAKRAMGIDWMTREQLAEAIPPAMTEFVGSQLLERLAAERAA